MPLLRRLMRLLHEVKSLPLQWKGRVFYHGTPSADAARAIFSDGYLSVGKGSSLFDPDSRPMEDRVYFAETPEEAIPYLLGGEFASRRMPPSVLRRRGRYGYLFVLDTRGLTDVYPDEASLGALVRELYARKFHEGEEWTPDERAFLHHCWHRMTQDERDAVVRGARGARVKVGRKLIADLPDDLTLWMLSQDTWPLSFANRGEAGVIRAYRFDRTRTPELEEDGSNFFDLAQPVRSLEDIR